MARALVLESFFFVHALALGKIVLYQTAEDYPAKKPYRLSRCETCATTNSTPAAGVEILTVDLATKYQTIQGFGGAFTDSVASVFSSLNSTLQEEVLEALWGDSGQGYNMARLTIGSTDFSTSIYNYNEPDGVPLSKPDYDQTSFSIAHDQKKIIPMILRAQKKADGALRFLSSSWSPPGWMKQGWLTAKGYMRNSAKPGMLPDPKVHKSYALYLSKYITAYSAAGVNISMMTIQNEPDSADHMAVAAYPACNFNGTDEGSFLKDHLGPQMRTDHPHLQIFVHDGQKFHDVPILDRVEDIIAAAGGDFNFIDGVAFHWYGNNLKNYQYLLALHEKYPMLPLLASEATLKDPRTQTVTTTPWKEAQKYGVDVIGDLNAFAEGWIEWNVLLDSSGGPTCIGTTNLQDCIPDIGHCDAPILADTKNQKLEYRSTYWVMGHFTRFLPRGSVRVAIANTTATEILFTAALTPANKLVVVVLNTENSGRTKPTQQYQLEVSGQYITTPPVPGHGLHTLVIDLD
jgi:glucosylceramidase